MQIFFWRGHSSQPSLQAGGPPSLLAGCDCIFYLYIYIYIYVYNDKTFALSVTNLVDGKVALGFEGRARLHSRMRIWSNGHYYPKMQNRH
jgi:hypothetical protein